MFAQVLFSFKFLFIFGSIIYLFLSQLQTRTQKHVWLLSLCFGDIKPERHTEADEKREQSS